jgi:ATP-dependent DNA helicase DinG
MSESIIPEERLPRQESVTSLDTSEIFKPDGMLAHVLPAYEHRPGQQRLADTITAIIADEASLGAEAATGIGKSQAYLVALIVSDTQAIISTETKVLQDQLREKDIPMLARALGRPIHAVVIKGRSNYICELEFHKFEAEAAADLGLFHRQENAILWPEIQAWVRRERAENGLAELDEAPLDIPDDLRQQITVTSDQCLGSKCPMIGQCFAIRARAQAKTADLVIVNHYLLLINGLLDGQLLPAMPVVVVDEAHALEEVASSVFSTKIGLPRWTWIQRQFQKLSSPLAETVEELLRDTKTTDAQRDLDRWLDEGAQAIDAARFSAEGRFTLWLNALGQRRSMPIPDAPELAPQIRTVVTILRRIVAAAMLAEVPEETLLMWDRLKSAAHTLATDLARAFEDPPSDDIVRFVEVSGHWPVVRLVPIDVSQALKTALWDRYSSVIATSATLTTGGNFDFWRERVGTPDDLQTIALPSPFNFQRQARLYLPRPAKDFEPAYPNHQGYDSYVHRMTETLMRLLQVSEGRALILCTSNRAMHVWAEQVRPSIPWRILVQGERSRHTLLREFSSDVHSVLFATKSFWQGVDIAGESLSLLVIDKLPFPSPDDPVFEAQCAMIDRERQGLSFSKLSMPMATLAIRQGFGRLIRRVTDRGVVALLDGRLQTKGYGNYILRSLPPAPKVYRVQDVDAFFGQGGAR